MVIIPPYVETIQDEERYGRFYGEINHREHERRVKDAETIASALEKPRIAYSDELYDSLQNLMEKQPRIALYLPFELLENAPIFFGISYINAWTACLSEIDERILFEGLPVPVNDNECCVKAIHLLPWLLGYGYIGDRELERILRLHARNRYIMQDLHDTLPAIKNLVGRKLYDEIENTTGFNSIDRKRSKIEKVFSGVMKPQAPNLVIDKKAIQNAFVKPLEPLKVALISGESILGCHPATSSDDGYNFTRITEGNHLNSPKLAGLYLSSVWAFFSGSEDEAERSRADMISPLVKCDSWTKPKVLKAIEAQIVLGRTLYNTRYAHSKVSHDTASSRYDGINGDSPFYDDRYRKLATVLFAKYVWIPKEEKH